MVTINASYRKISTETDTAIVLLEGGADPDTSDLNPFFQVMTTLQVFCSEMPGDFSTILDIERLRLEQPTPVITLHDMRIRKGKCQTVGEGG